MGRRPILKCESCRRDKKKCIRSEEPDRFPCRRCKDLGVPCSDCKGPGQSIRRFAANAENPAVGLRDGSPWNFNTPMLYEPVDPFSNVAKLGTATQVTPTSLDDERRATVVVKHGTRYEALQQSLNFDGNESRLRNIIVAKPQTSEWLFQNHNFNTWMSSEGSHHENAFLWIKGKPGSGKSTLMKAAWEYARHHETTAITLSHFFNIRGGLLARSVTGFWRNLLYQLLRFDASTREPCVSFFAPKYVAGDYSGAWTPQEIMNALIEIFESNHTPRTIRLFVDALDEIDGEADARELVNDLKYLKSIATLSGTNLFLCMATRHYPHISVLGDLSIELDSCEEYGQNVRLFIDDKLSFLQDETPADEMIKTRVFQRAEGIFLWVVLTCQIISHLHDQGATQDMMLRALDVTPPAVYEVYDSILNRDSDEMRLKDSLELFRWVLFSKRPLSVRELYTAACTRIQWGSSLVHDASQERCVRFVLYHSSGLLQLSNTPPPRVELVHASVRQYLLNRDRALEAGTSHAILARSCVDYLLTMSSDPDLRLNRERYSLAQYAALYWAQHALEAGKAGGAEFWDHACTLYKRETTLLILAELCDPDARKCSKSLNTQDLASPLYYAVWSGCSEIVRRLCEDRYDLNLRGGKHESPLLLGAYMGSTSNVSLLLEYGADVNIRSRTQNDNTPLHVASSLGNFEMVQMLVHAGADVNARNDQSRTPLHLASLGGHERSIHMLLAAGADVNAIGAAGSTALSDAASAGHTNICKLLLSAGADPDAFSGKALHCAAARGTLFVVQLLVDAGADVNARNNVDMSTIFDSPRTSRIDGLRPPLNAGDDHDASLRSGETALHLASSRGHEAVVRILIGVGADPNASLRSGETALHLASLRGHEAVVRSLLEVGADPNASLRSGETALHLASSRGHETVVQTLIQAGARLNVRNKTQDTPLELAIEHGHTNVAQLPRSAVADQGAAEIPP